MLEVLTSVVEAEEKKVETPISAMKIEKKTLEEEEEKKYAFDVDEAYGDDLADLKYNNTFFKTEDVDSRSEVDQRLTSGMKTGDSLEPVDDSSLSISAIKTKIKSKKSTASAGQAKK